MMKLKKWFYKYFEFSNYYPSKFTYENIEYSSVEQFFQANKFIDNKEYFNLIVILEINKKYINLVKIREDDMFVGLYEKFNQNTKLKKLLLSTDYYWGIGLDGSGKNEKWFCNYYYV